MPIIPASGDRVRGAVHSYTLIKLLNKGASANAFSATDETGERVFLKAYTSPTTFKPWYDGYLRHAIELNARLGTDPVLAQQTVRATDIFSAAYEHDGKLTRNPNIFQVFPFITGNRNLGDVIDGCGKSTTGAERLAMAAIFAGALARLHAAKVVHADLKPANVQMVRIGSGGGLSFRPLLVDMDFSVLADRCAPWHGDSSAGYVGTPGYFSPEHLRGEVPTTASDAFTAAIIIWQLLAGRHPFASALGDTAEPGDYQERVLAGCSDFGTSVPPFLDGAAVTDSLRRLLMAALSPDPTKRPTATDLHAALLEARRGGEPRHPTPGTRHPVLDTRHSTPDTRHPKHETHHPKPETRHSSPDTRLSSLVPAAKPRLILTGSVGSFSTGGRFAVTRTTLRKIVGDDARYAGDAPQFIVDRDGKGGWLLLPPPESPRNPTFHNGIPLTERVILAAGDTISIGPSKALCRVSAES
jgi:serine/threonine protein kinase